MANVSISAVPVIALEIDREGRLSRKLMRMDRDNQLDNTLLGALYPGIRVATVQMPTENLDQYEVAQVERALTEIQVDGVRYTLVGASGSAKKGIVYAVDAAHEKPLGERFAFWPQAAVTYFGILVSSCQVRIEAPDARVMVVKDRELGTNDCRGWLSESLFWKLQETHPNGARGLPAGRFYQFRLAFDQTQAKGSFKVMPDEVAQALGADIIIPESSVKPEYKGGIVRLLQWFLGESRMHRGPIVLGIREVSRGLEFESSYTLIEHAPLDSLQYELKPHAQQQVTKLKAAVDGKDFDELLRVLGTSDAQKSLHREDGIPTDSEYTSTENTIVEAVLKADPTGYLAKHPFINKQLQRLLAKWAFKVCTSGGFRMPAFALADDGYLFVHEGKVYSGADWIPKERAVVSLACDRFLVVRYPIRMKEDLLPIRKIDAAETLQLLVRRLRKFGCTMSEQQVLDRVLSRQLRLEGTLTLHSETAAKNGGDYDFDWVCVVEGNRFPRFVESRFAFKEQFTVKKDKRKKKQSPWWNLAQVALQAKGNWIGSITDLKTSCLAAGHPDLAYQLVEQLQNALDQLKHGTEPNIDVLREIRKRVSNAPWLKAKRVGRVSDLPRGLPLAETDIVGSLYNTIRQEIEDVFSEVLPLSDFRGVVTGGQFTREMYDECSKMADAYAAQVKETMEGRKKVEEVLGRAEAVFEAVQHDPARRKQALFRLKQARSQKHAFEERSRQELKAAISLVRKWAEGKRENRRGWLQALHARACRGNEHSTGSIIFYAFPQELVNQIVARTGGRPIAVAAPQLCDGTVRIDAEGRIFLVDQFDLGDGQVHEREVLLMQVGEGGEVIVDGRITERVRPFRIQAGIGEVRDGKVIFPGTQQRTFLPKPECKPEA